MNARHASDMISLLALAYLTLATSACLGLQNIRIQVNNENLQSPPYLLEALKQAAAVDSNSAGHQAAPAQPSVSASGGGSLPAPDGSSRLQASGANLGRGDAQEGRDTAASSSSGAIKVEAIEELLDLQPDSVLRLSPEGLINSVSSQEAAAAALAPASIEAASPLGADQEPQASSVHEVRKAQLPVTSSHLKRPALSAQQLDEPRQRLAALTGQSGVAEGDGVGGGAKSRISPSVAADEEHEKPAVNLENKRLSGGPHPPDIWEAGQVMQGVTNVSLVPATVRRQYGHQTRTRITLGGGYTRDKLPPLVDPSSSDYHDDRPEKPLAPLERPHAVSAQLAEGSNADDYEQSGSGLVENSRLIEVPKRIVLPVGVFNQDEASGGGGGGVTKRPAASVSVTVSRKRDSRCPANGVTSLEHPTACDKYFLCQDGLLSEQTCPNGLLYGTRDVVRDFCVHRWEAVCGDKSVPNPISSPGCRWQYGIFQVQGSPKCVPDFYECKEGQFEVRKCSIGGQVYDDKTKSCRYAEQVGCTQEALADFRCPADDQTNTYWPFPRYFLNERALIHCVNDKPEIIRCRDHERVDPEHLFCVPINKSSSDGSTSGNGDDQSAPEVTARRSTNTAGQQREKAAPAGTTTDNNKSAGGAQAAKAAGD